MIAEARRHIFVARVPHPCLHEQRRAIQGEADIQFETKRIELESFFVGLQAEDGGGGTRIYYFKKPAAREAMPGESIDSRAEAIAAAVEGSHDGKKQRCPSGPDGRIAVPQ